MLKQSEVQEGRIYLHENDGFVRVIGFSYDDNEDVEIVHCEAVTDGLGSKEFKIGKFVHECSLPHKFSKS